MWLYLAPILRAAQILRLARIFSDAKSARPAGSPGENWCCHPVDSGVV